MSEIRLGKALLKRRRDYMLSTKAGRLILDEVEAADRAFGEKGDIFKHGRPNKIIYDYTADGVSKSIAQSRMPIGVDPIDFVWVQDIARDFHRDGWLAKFEEARTGASRALDELRDQGVIAAWASASATSNPWN